MNRPSGLTDPMISRFVSLVCDTKLSYNPDAKAKFANLGKRILRGIGKELGLPEGSFEVRFCAGGIAVSGDCVLHGESIYIKMAQTTAGIMYRSCDGREDYCGHVNHWLPYSTLLLNRPQLVSLIRTVMVGRANPSQAAVRPLGIQTPWGVADSVTEVGEGILFVSTPSHGGYFVPADLVDRISPEGRAMARKWSGSDQWYEEDCIWAYVAVAYPLLFPPEGRERAQDMVKYLEQKAKVAT